jgi:colanic acid/amylovoran biosynthesis glycosyltransferase
MSSPSVLSVVNSFPSTSETFVLRKLEAFRAAGIDVSVAAASFGPGARQAGFDLVQLAPWQDPKGAVRALGGAGAVRSAAALARSAARGGGSSRDRLLHAPLAAAGADIVHFEFSGIAVAYRRSLAALRPARLVVSCRGSAEQVQPAVEPGRAEALRAVFDEVDLIHCVSGAMADTVAELGADRAKVLVNRPAVPVDLLAPLAQRRQPHGGPMRVLAIGRLQWVKGFDDAVRSVGRLRDEGIDVHLRIVGDGPEREKLAFLVHRLGLEHAVSLVGTQSQEQVRDQLVWADALVLTSLSEGISNAVLEAMAAGLPVVTTDCGGMPEVVADGVEGFVVPVGDIAAIAGRLADLEGDGALRSRLGAAGAARAVAEFGLDRQISAFVDAYRSLGA